MDLYREFGQLSKRDQLHLYINNVHPILNRDALFTDGTPYYRSYEKDGNQYQARLRFRTGRDNVDEVMLVTSNARYPMTCIHQNRIFDFFEVTIPVSGEGLEYYFEIVSGKNRAVYNKLGVKDEPQNYYNFKLMPEFETPDWAKGAVFYQIFVDRFYNGDPTNDVRDREYIYINEYSQKVKDWASYPTAMDVRRFYGGDLQGVMEKLDYLQDLGVDVLYLNPIFVSPSNHKYDIQDYDYVDPHYGVIVNDDDYDLPEWDKYNGHARGYIARVTDKANLEASNALFIRLVEEIHRRGMRVILDGVFNHCGSFNKWMDREGIYEHVEGYQKGAYVEQESPYNTFFKFNGNQWPYNPSYDGWWGHDTLPKLNYEESPKLYEDIMRIARKWVSPPFNVDGWRLDVAADLGHSQEFNHKFWKDFRKTVKEANPDALILAEHYGDPASWLGGDEWDTVMNYDAFMEPITWFLTGLEKHSDEYRGDLLNNSESFQAAMGHHMSRLHWASLQVSMNELSNHDHSRFLTRTNRTVGRTNYSGPEAANANIDKGVFRAAVVFQMTWPGAPTIYYGDEAGLCGWTDPDNRRTYPWGNEDQELIRFHKDVIRIHKGSSALMTGSTKFLMGAAGVLAYGRFNEDEAYAVIINNQNFQQIVQIPVWQIGVFNGERMMELLMSRQDAYRMDPMIHTIKDGLLTIQMPKVSAVILRKCNKDDQIILQQQA